MNQDLQSESKLAKPTSKLPKFLGLIVLFSVIAGGAYYKYSGAKLPEQSKQTVGKYKFGRGHDEEDRPVVVSLESVKLSDFPVYLNGLGTVTALGSVTVRPKVDGELINVVFKEGQSVRAGQLLAEIDPRSFQIQLQQAEGQLLRDQALLQNAQLDLKRYQTLLEKDSISAQQASAQQSQVKQYQGLVAMDQAQVNNAKLLLSYTRVTAPISGRTGLRKIDRGNIVHVNDVEGLVMITQLQPVSVVFSLPEDKVQTTIKHWRADKSLPVDVYDRSGKNQLAQCQLHAIDNQIDSTTGTLKFKAQCDNDDLTLFSNQFVNIKLQLETLKAVTTVSSAAIQHDTQGAFVYVIKDSKAQLRRITLGPSEGEQVAVLSNLAANEALVVDGIDGLQEGAIVDVAELDGQAVAAKPKAVVSQDPSQEAVRRKSKT